MLVAIHRLLSGFPGECDICIWSDDWYHAWLCHVSWQYGYKKAYAIDMADMREFQHVEWYKAKMQVKLAAQTFSASVVDALATLRVLNSRFTDADPTIEFIRQAS